MTSGKGPSEGRVGDETYQAPDLEGNHLEPLSTRPKGKVEVDYFASSRLWCKWEASRARKSAGNVLLGQAQSSMQKGPYFPLTKA